MTSETERAGLVLCLLFFAQCQTCRAVEGLERAADRSAVALERMAEALERGAAVERK